MERAMTEAELRAMAVDVGITKMGIGGLEKNLGARIDGVEDKVDGLSAKVEKLAACVAENKLQISRIIAWGGGFSMAAGAMYALIRYLATGAP
jgi:hypothetical protein